MARRYLPFSDGIYTVTARLRPLAEEPHFQVDDEYLAYVTAKAANRRNARERYCLRDGLTPALERAIVEFAVPALARQQPHAFEATMEGETARLVNRLLGLSLVIDLTELKVVEAARVDATLSGGESVYADVDFVGLPALEALALQTQEDWAVVARDPETRADKTVALHVSFPSHWRPIDKIGRSFAEVHQPVAGIGPLLKAASSILDAMVNKGPWERFTWTLPRTPHLDEHLDVVAERPRPELPAVADVGASTWLRVERQVIQGFPAADGALFMIRLHITPLVDVAADPEAARALASAVRSKTPEQRVYKQLGDWHETLTAYLDAAGSH